MTKNPFENYNIFNYDKKIKNMVGMVIQNSPPDILEENLDNLSYILYDNLYDIYEESLRDEDNWERYFNKIKKIQKTKILGIDKMVSNKTTKKKELV